MASRQFIHPPQPNGFSGVKPKFPIGQAPSTKKPKPKKKTYTDPMLGQAQGLVSSLFGPLFDQLGTRQAGAEERARAAYAQHASALESALGASAAPLAGIYGRAASGVSGVEDAVRATLGGQGAAASSNLTQQLAQIGGTAPAQLPGVYDAAVGSNYAYGMNDVSRLLARGAEAQAYAAKQPGIARIEASRDLGSALIDIRGQYGEEGASLRASIPEAVLGLYGNLQEQQSGREELRSKERLALQALQDEEGVRALERQWKVEDRNFAANQQRELARYEYMTSAQTDADKRAFDMQMAAIDRQFKAGEKAKDRAAAAKRAQQGGGKTGASSRVDVRVRRSQAWNKIQNMIFNPNTQQQRQWITNAPSWNSIVPRINAHIRAAGFAANSPEGIALRKQAFKALGIATGEKGNPVGEL